MNTRALRTTRVRATLGALVTGILVATTLLLAVPATASSGSGDRWARVSAPDQQLRPGCRSYAYRYRVAAPGEAWMVELFLVAPSGRRLASETLDSAAQPASARRTWRVCRTSTRPGVHRIGIKVTSYDGRETTERWMAPVRFRLSR